MVTPDGSDDGPTVTGRTRLKRERITRVNLVISTRLTALLNYMYYYMYYTMCHLREIKGCGTNILSLYKL